MQYSDGQRAKVGDIVMLAGELGEVVCSIDDSIYSPAHPENQWAYLTRGIMVEFKAFGLIHYENAEEDLTLVRRTTI